MKRREVLTMNDISRCPDCGAELAADVPKALCPHCALKGLLEPSGLGSASQAASHGSAAEAHPNTPLAASHSPSDEEKRPSGQVQRNSGVGRQFGDYELLEEIARGGMGVVYKARQRSLDRLVAVKFLLFGPHAGAEFIKRFRIEASAAAALQHPNIVAIHEVGVHEGEHFLVMDYVDGPNFAKLVREQPLPPKRAAQYLKTIAEAIHYAHERGILHRDLKPSNVLIDSNDHPRVTDFGLAKRFTDSQLSTQDASQLTFSGQVMGSPGYIPPEQASGARGKVGRPSDVYGLGGILYYLLTARAPFQGESIEATLHQVLTAEPASPRLLNPAVPRDLETICLKCLEKQSSHRYRSAHELAEDLGRVMRHEPIRARRTNAFEKIIKWARRKPVMAALVGVTGLAVLALIGALTAQVAFQSEQTHRKKVEAALTQAEQARKAEEEARKLQATALTEARRAREAEAEARMNEARQRTIAEAALAEAERATYFRNISYAERDFRANNVARAEQLLDECKPELRGWEWKYLKRLCHSDLLTLSHDSGVKCVAFSSNGLYLASGTADGTVTLFSPVTGDELFSLKLTTNGINSLAFDPVVNRLTAASGSDLFILDTVTGELVQRFNAHSGTVTAVAYSPNGKFLASASADRIVRIWDANTLGLFLSLTNHTESVNCVAFSPDGRRLVSGSGQAARTDRNGRVIPEVPGQIKVWDANSGEAIFTLSDRESIVSSVAFSPDGRFIVSGQGNGVLKLWDGSTGQPILSPLRNHIDSVLAVAFYHSRVVSASADTTVRYWDRSTGTELANYRGHTKDVTCLAVSPDRKLIASGSEDTTLKLWKAGSAPESAIFIALTDGAIQDICFSPDGSRVAFFGTGGIEVWDFLKGEKLFSPSHYTNWSYRGMAFSPDGGYLAARKDKTVGIWNTANWEEVHTLQGHQGAITIYGVAYSADGKLLASCSWGGKAKVKIWNASTGMEMQVIEGVTNAVWNVAFSPDSRRLAAAMGNFGRGKGEGGAWWGGHPGEVKIWDLADGKVIHTLRGHRYCVWNVAFSPTGNWLASCGGCYQASPNQGEVKIWDSVTGQELLSLPVEPNCIFGIAFSPDGRRLASGGGTFGSKKPAQLQLWEVLTGKEVLSLHGHQGTVYSVAFSRDGNYLASGSQDGTVRIWDASEATPETQTARRLTWLGKETVERAAREQSQRLEEAYRVLSERINESRVNSLTPTNALVRRARVLRHLNRQADARADEQHAMGISGRDSQAQPNLIDLTTFYNAGLNSNWHGDEQGNSLAGLPRGVQTLADIDFDVRGIVQVQLGSKAFPPAVTNVTVAQACSRLHFLHAAIRAQGLTNGILVGRYLIHFEDGQHCEIPIVVGKDLADWWPQKDETNTTFVVAWTGANEKSQRTGGKIRLFKSTWENPRPDLVVRSIDFEAIHKTAAPFLIAITAEP